MKFTDTSDEIVIRHIPFRQWIVGGAAVFIFVGLGFWILYVDLIGSWPSIIYLIAVIWLVVSEMRVFPMVFAPLTTVIVSQKTNSINISWKKVHRRKVSRFYFFQISKFKSYKKHSRFASKYFLALVLANQKVIKLKIPLGTKQDTIKMVKKLNKFIRSKKHSEAGLKRRSFEASHISA